MPSIIGRTTRNLPGGLTLDTDSELDVSKIQLRHHLANANTTRNIRNRTIARFHTTSNLQSHIVLNPYKYKRSCWKPNFPIHRYVMNQ